MPNPHVAAALKADGWSLVERRLESGPAMLRFRTPVLGPSQVEGYGRALRILWPYADEGSGAMPHRLESEAMGEFEDRFCAAVESDAHAFLAAVLTFDGARQWIFYTADVAECGRRLEAMPQNEAPYPIELDAFDDPDWSYLREKLLGPASGAE
jgi:hypothetical protein